MKEYSNIEKKVIEASLQECKDQTLESTKQFFMVHELRENPVAQINKSYNNYYNIYLKVKTHQYYWALQFEIINGLPVVKFGSCWNHANIYLSITSTSVHPDKITKLLKIDPSEKRVKGEPPFPNVERLNKVNRWKYNYPLDRVADCLEDKIERILNDIAPKFDALEHLSDELSVFIGGALYELPEYSGGFIITPDQMAKMSKINAIFNIDLYASSIVLPRMPDRYIV